MAAQLSNPSSSSSTSPSSSRKQAIFIVSLVTLWYSSNIGVLLLNKYLLSNYGFRFPIFLTMCHMSACAILSYLSIVFLKVVPLQTLKSRPQLLKISTLSVVFCASVVGGNISLRYLPVSFNQAVGATTPFFTAVFAYLMTFKREAWVTYFALVPVVVGVVIASGVFQQIYYNLIIQSDLNFMPDFLVQCRSVIISCVGFWDLNFNTYII
ncbi:UDP-URONIC ACID TRANSPORTER 1 [Linum perenne]